MKKLFALILSACLCLSFLAACGGAGKSNNTYNIAIVQQLDHASLDEIRVAVESTMTAAASEKGITVNVKTYNGQNDATMLNQIGTQVVSDKVDMIIPIATMAAQCMVTAAEGTEIPIVYAAISDPESAGLLQWDVPSVLPAEHHRNLLAEHLLGASGE